MIFAVNQELEALFTVVESAEIFGNRGAYRPNQLSYRCWGGLASFHLLGLRHDRICIFIGR